MCGVNNVTYINWYRFGVCFSPCLVNCSVGPNFGFDMLLFSSLTQQVALAMLRIRYNSLVI